MFELTEKWKSTYPGASVGVLAMRNVTNPKNHPQLDELKGDLESELRAQYDGYNRASLKALPVLTAYATYYKEFNKTYHVQHQLESVVIKDRNIPKVASLVEAMFMAELKNLMLTAGHDLNMLALPLHIDIAEGTESYLRMNGDEQILKAGDMMIADRKGIISCIIYGPDQRTRIRPETKDVIFTVYAPPGIEVTDVHSHLKDIQNNIKVIAPEASVVLLKVLSSY